MKLITLAFDDGDPWYHRAAKVLVASALKHDPSLWVKIVVEHEADPDIKHYMQHGRRQLTFCQNTRKTRIHRDEVRRAAHGEILCFVDADAMVVNKLSDALPLVNGSDITITVRSENNRYVFNSGVVFCRVSDRTRELYKLWADRAWQMLVDPALHQKWRKVYGGINQSAFGSLMNEGVLERLGVSLGRIPNREWNALSADHQHALKHGYILHMLGSMRRSAMKFDMASLHRCSQARQEVVKAWLEYDAQQQL